MQWEYYIMRIISKEYAEEHPDDNDYVIKQEGIDFLNKKITKSEQNLNKWGEAGWEIAGVSSDERGSGYIYLKRPKKPTN